MEYVVNASVTLYYVNNKLCAAHTTSHNYKLLQPCFYTLCSYQAGQQVTLVVIMMSYNINVWHGAAIATLAGRSSEQVELFLASNTTTKSLAK